MSTCGTYIGPSVTGAVHVVECGKLLHGKFVTVKIVHPNHIKNEMTKGGENNLALAEIVVTGIVV